MTMIEKGFGANAQQEKFKSSEFVSEVLELTKSKDYKNLEVDNDFGQKWELGDFTKEVTFKYGDKLFDQMNVVDVSAQVEEFYDELVKVNPALNQINVQTIEDKINVIRGIGSGLHVNDIKFFVEDLKGSAKNLVGNVRDLNEQAVRAYIERANLEGKEFEAVEDAYSKVGFAFSPETAQRIIDNKPYNQE
ncbi:MAG TPA: hypothetical protein VGE63_02665 [Candidatus Paceibacterota bacterium]